MRFVYALAVLACTAFALFGNEPPAVKDSPPSVRNYGITESRNIPPTVAHSSVYISVDLGGGSTAGGTGTVIAAEGGKSLVLTNAHVVPSAAHPITVTYWSDGAAWTSKGTYLGGSSVDELGGNLIRVNGPDLALLSVNADLQPVEIATAIPAAGTAVRLYGFGGNTSVVTPTLKAGRVLHEDGRQTMAGDPIARTSIATVNGDSGAGILDREGRLVAVHWGGGAVRLDTVHAFTVQVLDRKGLFSRLKARLTARKISKAVAAAFAQEPPPVRAPAPAPIPAAAPAGHWESRCGTDSRGRKVCYRVWIND